MTIPFQKYHGTGNDFIMIDQREQQYLTRKDQAIIEKMCTRHFGIGADGLILLQNHAELDFEMIYFNSDGRESSMCGNGGRCIVAFAHQLGVFKTACQFWAIDGLHEAVVKDHWVELKMSAVEKVETYNTHYFLDTGSPHHVAFIEDVEKVNIVAKGSEIRYSDTYQPLGTNVNFVQASDDKITVATYERGVENETLSCGTGVTAAAIAYHLQNPTKKIVDIVTKGGQLQVKLKPENSGFDDIWLCGPTKEVFRGVFDTLTISS
ncbi:MAG: diaminopimelate epimerase [Bacteroidota bacterium]